MKDVVDLRNSKVDEAVSKDEHHQTRTGSRAKEKLEGREH